MPRHRRRKIVDVWSAVIFLALVTLDAFVWSTLAGDHRASAAARIWFLNVDQGESALVIFPGGVTELTDAGGDDSVVDTLANAMPPDDAHIDLAVISYPEHADYDGYSYLLDHYSVGAFLYNGRDDADYGTDWSALVAKIAAKHIPLIAVGAGDRIRIGGGVFADGVHAGTGIDILSPDADFVRSPDPTDTGIVQRLITPQLTALLSADIGANVTGFLLAKGVDLRADVLKVPIPALGGTTGNAFGTSGVAFLRGVSPRIAVITPGIKATPSAPSKGALGVLAAFASSAKALVISTVASGTAGISPDRGQFLLYNDE